MFVIVVTIVNRSDVSVRISNEKRNTTKLTDKSVCVSFVGHASICNRWSMVSVNEIKNCTNSTAGTETCVFRAFAIATYYSERENTLHSTGPICPNWLLHCAMAYKLSMQIICYVRTMFITHNNKSNLYVAPCTTFYIYLFCFCAALLFQLHHHCVAFSVYHSTSPNYESENNRVSVTSTSS